MTAPTERDQLTFVALHERASSTLDPRMTFIPEYHTHERYYQPVAYMTQVRPRSHGRGALYQGGVNESLWLPLDIRYVVSLHAVEYIRHHPLRGFAYFDAEDSLDQDPSVFVAASEVAMTFWKQGDGDVLIHCMAGLNRSGVTTALTIMHTEGWTAEATIQRLRALRSPDVLYNPAFEAFVRTQGA
jgi:hypothetical protein